MTLTLNISINLNTADFDQADQYVIDIATHLAQLANATRGDAQAILDLLTTHYIRNLNP